MKNEKITIFLSHSHKDYEKARKIRDILEMLDCEPLIFYLKCLDDNNAELEQFIKKEIEARNIFIYCKSQNAEKSVWVQKELEYIKSFDKKRLYTIDIEDNFTSSVISFLKTLADILGKNRVYISHASRDQDVFNTIADRLEANGYQILNLERSSNPGVDYLEYVPGALAKATSEGVFIALFSPNSPDSFWYPKEVATALGAIENNGGRFLLVLVDDDGNTDMPIKYRFLFDGHTDSALVIHRQPTESELKTLVDRLNAFSNDDSN